MGLLEKIKENLFLIPNERFEGLTKDPGYKDSFVYLVVCLVISLVISVIVGFFSLGNYGGSVAGLFTALIIGTIIAIPFYYIGYIIFHILLKIVGAKEGFLKTVQVFVYGGTPALIFGSIPLINLIALLVALVNIVRGAAVVHKISTLRAAIALVVIPVIIGVILAIALAALFATLIASLMGASAYTY